MNMEMMPDIGDTESEKSIENHDDVEETRETVEEMKARIVRGDVSNEAENTTESSTHNETPEEMKARILYGNIPPESNS